MLKMNVYSGDIDIKNNVKGVQGVQKTSFLFRG